MPAHQVCAGRQRPTDRPASRKSAARSRFSNPQGSFTSADPPDGEGQPLTRLNAIALAGSWYAWLVAAPLCKVPADLPGRPRAQHGAAELAVQSSRDESLRCQCHRHRGRDRLEFLPESQVESACCPTDLASLTPPPLCPNLPAPTPRPSRH